MKNGEKRKKKRGKKELILAISAFPVLAIASRQIFTWATYNPTSLMAFYIIWIVISLAGLIQSSSPSTSYSTGDLSISELATATSLFKNHDNEQCSTNTCTEEVIENLLFDISITAFQHARISKTPSECIWYSDLCSKSPDEPLGFNFSLSCSRHDFGYHNLKKQKRFTREMRRKIDTGLREDLYGYCSQFCGRNFWKGIACRFVADAYYVAARVFGNSHMMGKHRHIYDLVKTASAENLVSI